MKRCSKCGIEQPLENFYRAPGSRDGLRGDCKACFKERAAARYRANPEPVKERVREWARQNPDRVRERAREYRLSGRKAVNDRRSHLKRKFGITPETYDEMLADQRGVCAICERPPRDDISLHVDHEHGTGRVRGLLCFRCNNALGDFEDDAVLLLRAADYVVFDPEARELATRRLAALVVERSR